MNNVARLHAPTSVPFAEARARFLRRDAFEATTRTAYGRTLLALEKHLGPELGVDQITAEQLEDLLETQWGHTAATTYNRHRAALLSFCGWCLRRGWVATNAAALVENRKVRRRSEDDRRDRPISEEQLDELWALPRVRGRDRLMWRMAYETWARADELLGINIEDLDLLRMQGDVVAKGGDVETVWWSTGSARLLPRVISVRSRGPLFTSSRLPTQPMPISDLDPVTGRARLSYRQAERIFTAAGRRVDPHGAAWTLHRLRHSGISHAVEQGWDSPMLRAKSRHASLRSLEVYTNPSEAAVRLMTDRLDPEARRSMNGVSGRVHG